MTAEEYVRKIANKRHKEWRDENKDKMAAINKRAYEKNREKRLLQMKVYREKNKKQKL